MTDRRQRRRANTLSKRLINELIIDIRREFGVNQLPNHVRRRKTYVDFYHVCMKDEDLLMWFIVAPFAYLGLIMIALLREECPCHMFDPTFFSAYVTKYIKYYRPLHLNGISITKSQISILIRFYEFQKLTVYYKTWASDDDYTIEYLQTALSDWDDELGSMAVQSKTWECIPLYWQ